MAEGGDRRSISDRRSSHGSTTSAPENEVKSTGSGALANMVANAQKIVSGTNTIMNHVGDNVLAATNRLGKMVEDAVVGDEGLRMILDALTNQ